MSLLAPAPRTASVVALTEVTLVVLTRETVEEELASMKPWMGLFVRHLSARFRELQEERFRDEKKALVRPWWRLW